MAGDPRYGHWQEGARWVRPLGEFTTILGCETRVIEWVGLPDDGDRGVMLVFRVPGSEIHRAEVFLSPDDLVSMRDALAQFQP